MSSRGALTTLRRRALGVALLMCMVLFVGLTVAIYNRAFESTVDVLLRTPSTGNQLKTESDVKVRGVNVGRVEDVSATGDGAQLKLALQPDKARMLPANVWSPWIGPAVANVTDSRARANGLSGTFGDCSR